MDIYFEGNKKVFADVNGFTVKTDQGERSGGDGEYPDPFTMFLASLGTCSGIFVKFFCDQRGLPADKIRLTQEQVYDPAKKMIGKININIHIPEDFPEKYEQPLLQAAGLCTVKKHIREDIDITVKTVRE